MPTNTLSDAKCKAAKPKEKAYKLFDGGGLYLWVSPTGAKTWRLAYRHEGKQQQISLGPYPEVSLADARVKRDGLRVSMRSGENPMTSRKKQSTTVFSDAVLQFWNGRGDVTDAYRQNALRGIEMHLFPRLSRKYIADITRDDLLESLRIMDANGLHVYVRKVRMWVSQVFEWAVENGYATSNPASSIKPERAFGRTTVKNFSAVDLNELPDLVKRLAFENQDLQSVLACRMLALTWVRTVELRMMEWSEIDGDVWRIPAGKMKRRRDHLVPLSKQAQAIIKTMKARCRGDRYVFEAEHRPDRPISENAILYLLHRIGYQGRMTGHGWRSVASTWANENGYNRDAIERQLAHAPDDKVRAAYNRAEYLPERKKMLQDWANFLDSITD